MAFDFFQQFNPKNDKEIVEESKVHHLSKMKEFSEESESNIQDWYEDQMASSLFQQFNPKSVKEILEETKEYQLSKMKDFSEELESHIQDWYADRIEYLREHHSSHKVLSWGQDWNPTGPNVNSMGNEILFYDVDGGNGDNRIDMDIETHDEINGGDGSDEIYAGWGNDIIDAGSNGHRGSDGEFDYMYGEEGNDIITAYRFDEAYGGVGRDQLIGYGGGYLDGGENQDQLTCYGGGSLRGGSDSDIFTINVMDPEEDMGGGYVSNSFRVRDLSAEDKLIINFTGSGLSFGGIETGPVGTMSELQVFDNTGELVVGTNEIDFRNDFEFDLSTDQMMLTLTGSEFM